MQTLVVSFGCQINGILLIGKTLQLFISFIYSLSLALKYPNVSGCECTVENILSLVCLVAQKHSGNCCLYNVFNSDLKSFFLIAVSVVKSNKNDFVFPTFVENSVKNAAGVSLNP